MQAFCLTLSRFLLAGWCGAAVLFVVTAVAEQTSPEFSSATKSALALIRFPWYYGFGFVMLTLALLLGLVGLRQRVVGNLRRVAFAGLTVLALGALAVDFVFVYRPLSEMTSRPTRPAEFRTYHEYSERINTASLGLALLAALVVCWPTWEPEEED